MRQDCNNRPTERNRRNTQKDRNNIQTKPPLALTENSSNDNYLIILNIYKAGYLGILFLSVVLLTISCESVTAHVCLILADGQLGIVVNIHT